MTKKLRLAKPLLFLVAIFMIVSAGESFAQHLTSTPHRGVVQVPIGDQVYPLLRHLYLEGAIKGYSETELPISEYDVVTFLRSADQTKLSNSDKASVAKFLRTYAHDPVHVVSMFPADSAEPLFFAGIPTDNDKYLYRWSDDSNNSDLFVHGIASLELRDRIKPNPGKVELGVIGGRFSGTVGGHVGFFLQSTNGQDFGDSTIALEDPILAGNKNFTLYSKKDFDFTSAELSYNYDWFTAKLAREAISVGGSYQQDNIILSSNTPFYDFVSIGAHVGAVRYEAMVASLLGEARWSVGYDSANPTTFGAGAQIDPKYLTLHDLTFTINDNLELGFTDMVIYSRRFDIGYANPFSFLKSVEHSLNDRDNGMLAVHARWKIADGIEVRGQGLVDDVVASKIGTGYWSNKFAWQFGGMWANPLGLKDLDLMAEWTRIEPYTFTHFNPQNTFSTSTTLMSNQIGPNSISYWFSGRWAPSEHWSIQLEAQLIQRGENIYDSTGKVLLENHGSDYEYTISEKGNGDIPVFILEGRRVNITNLTAIIQFEPWRGLQLFARATDKLVSYVLPNPYPLQHPETLIAFGAQALF